jgi:ABC-type transporter Mla subunit MlaD
MPLGVLALIVGAGIGFLAYVSVLGLPWQHRYTFTVVVPGATTPPPQVGGIVRVDGNLAGAITSVTSNFQTARITAEIDSKYAPLGRNAQVAVAVVPGTSAVFLNVEPGDWHRALPSGSVIPGHDVTVGTSIAQVLSQFNTATRTDLSRDIYVIGSGFNGNGETLGDALGQLPDLLQGGTAIAHALLGNTSTGTLATHLLDDGAQVAHTLRGLRPNDVADTITQSRRVADAFAAEQKPLGEALDKLASLQQVLLPAAPLVSEVTGQIGTFAQAATPVANEIAPQLAGLAHVFSQGRNLVQAVKLFNPPAHAVLRVLAKLAVLLRDPAEDLQPLLASTVSIAGALSGRGQELQQIAAGVNGMFGSYEGRVVLVKAYPSLACAPYHDAYPAPGQADKDAKPCT